MLTLEEAHDQGVVIGLKDVAGMGVRRDIDVMMLEQPDTFNLLIIAFLELMAEKVPWEIPEKFKVDPADKFSFFQMAGIHGLPNKTWDGVGNLPDGSKDIDGFCAHGVPTFEAWHRPYLAMLEQTLFRQIDNIADRFGRSNVLTQEEKEQYKKAAKEFRLPYFDYYRPRDYTRIIPGVTEPAAGGRNRNTAILKRLPYDFGLPQIFTLPRIMVKTLPDNEIKTMRNPFFQYRMPKDALNDKEWKVSNIDISVPSVKDRTMRYGSDKYRSVTWMNDNLNKLREDILRITLSLIEPGVYEKFGAVATSETLTPSGVKFNPQQGLAQSPAGSLEAVHNDYHVYLGGFLGSRADFSDNDKTRWVGYMTSVPVAAFDPVFWIHHCQIDRLFAIWQAANPKSWFDDLPTKELRELAQSKLLPFRSSKTPAEDFWTPDTARETATFGYTYPDLEHSPTPDVVRENFKHNYAWSRRLEPEIVVGYDQRPPTEMEPLDVSQAQVFQYEVGSTEEYLFEKLQPAPPPKRLFGKMAPRDPVKRINEFSHEWYIDDAIRRMALNGSFTIFYLIELDGVGGENAAEWTTEPGFAGLTHIFASPREVCDNCDQQDQQGKIVTSTTPITSLLLDYVEAGKLESMDEKHVKPFLIKNLKWRCQTVMGEVVNPRDLQGAQFTLSISCKTAPLPGIEGEVTYTIHREIIDTIINNSA